MNSVKTLHILNKFTKDGRPYWVYVVLITLDSGDEFIKNLVVFPDKKVSDKILKDLGEVND